jgi:MFS family permease
VRRDRSRLTAATLAVLLGAADTYVVVLLLPSIMQGVGLDTAELQRAAPLVSGFLLGYVALLPAAGRLSDLVGRVPVLTGCLVVFTAGAVVTATSHGLGQAVTGRLLQGVGAGGLVPVTLALVADRWPSERRAVPLGVVGAVQEVGALIGPLVGAAVLAVAGWRAAFWGGALLALLLAVLIAGSGAALRADAFGSALLVGVVAAEGLDLLAPDRLVSDVTVGSLWSPTRLGLTPLTMIALGLGAALCARELVARRPLLDLRRLPALAREVDATGVALLALALGAVVLAFAGADPERSALAANAPYTLPLAVVAGCAFAVRQRTARTPLIPIRTLADRGAACSLLVSLLVGTALVAVLVDVPVYARTTLHDSTQLDAALVLVRFLVAVPVGALVGGWATRRRGALPVGAAGLALVTVGLLAMSRWGLHALTREQLAANAALAVTGLGFGLAVAPVNVTALARAAETAHGIVSSLIVVARTVGMLVGLSVLSAVGLRVYAERAGRIPSPVTLCPDTPLHCSAFGDLTRAAVVDELQVVFLLAAIAAALAAVVWITLSPRRIA